MTLYGRTRTFTVSFLALILFGGLAALPLPGQEVFPFYSWFLFALVPPEETRYEVLIHEYNRRVHVPPLRYQEAKKVLPRPDSMTAFKLMQRIGAAQEAGDMEERDLLRETFEANYLPKGARYELVKIKYDPLKDWDKKKRDMRDAVSLETFETFPRK